MRLAIARKNGETWDAPEEIFAKTGDVYNIFALLRNDGTTKSLMFKHLESASRRANFTDNDRVGVIAYEIPGGGIPTYGDVSDAVFAGGVFTIPVLSEDPAPVDYPALSAARWRTMISRLAAGQKDALRNAIQAALALDPADPTDDTEELAYLAEMGQRAAAQRLISLERAFPHTSTIADLATIGITLTSPQQDAFDARWLQAGAL